MSSADVGLRDAPTVRTSPSRQPDGVGQTTRLRFTAHARTHTHTHTPGRKNECLLPRVRRAAAEEAACLCHARLAVHHQQIVFRIGTTKQSEGSHAPETAAPRTRVAAIRSTATARHVTDTARKRGGGCGAREGIVFMINAIMRMHGSLASTTATDGSLGASRRGRRLASVCVASLAQIRGTCKINGNWFITGRIVL